MSRPIRLDDAPPLSDQLLACTALRPAAPASRGGGDSYPPADPADLGLATVSAVAGRRTRKAAGTPTGTMPPCRTVLPPIDRRHVPAATRLDAVLERAEAALALLRQGEPEAAEVALMEALAYGDGGLTP